MYANDDISTAVSLLKQTLPEMQKRNIAATPENYAIWYEYVSGRNASLVNEVNLLDLNRTPFTTAIHKELYSKHVASEREALVNKLSDNVKEVINSFLLKSKHEGEGLEMYSKALNDMSAEVEALESVGELRLVVSQLIEHTREREVAACAMQESLASMSSEMQKLKAEVSRLSGESSTDPLTRIPTKNVFLEDLETHIAMAKSEGESLCIALLEVDEFTAFRDKFGDVIGDKVLKFIATLFKKHIKGNDLLARYGEHCFAVLLPETEIQGAKTASENLRERLAKQTLSDSAEKVQLGTITVSTGLARLSAGTTKEALLESAQSALSKAKLAGGNTVHAE